MLRAAILIGALGAGGAAAWVAANMVSPPSAPNVTVDVPQATAQVLVAAVSLNPGSVLKPGDMRWQPWAEDALVEGLVVQSAQPDAPEIFVGQQTRSDLATGEPIRVERLVRGEGGLLSVMLATGRRAIAVRVSAQSTAGGFIMPGDRVDVVRTVSRTDATGQTRMVSETLLRNIRVLAIDQSTENRGEGAVLGQTATLELDAAQVELVVAGEAMGMLSLSLRSFADNNDAPQIAEAPIPPFIQTQPRNPPVRIFRSGRVEEVDLR